MRKVLLFCLFLMYCFGCAVSIKHGLTKDFPLYQSKTHGPNFIVIRENQFVGGGALMQLLINGTPVAGMVIGEYVRLYLPPGQHIISARIWTGKTGYLPILIPPTGAKIYELSLTHAGELNFFEIPPDQIEDYMYGKHEIGKVPDQSPDY